MIANSVDLWDIARATLLLSVSTLLVAGLWRWRRATAPTAIRLACLLVLAQGWFIYRLPVSVPWHDAPGAKALASFEPARPEAPSKPTPRVEAPGEHAMAAAPSVSTWRPPTLKDALVILWLAGPLVLTWMFIRDYRRFIANIAGAEAAPEEWQEQWKGVCESRRVRPAIPMFATASVGPLLCWSAGGHRLLVPVDYWRDLSFDQRETVLRHELAHYLRGDIWKSLLVRLAALPQWFNPFAWRLVRWFDEGAELACDRAVVQGAPQLAGQYARALLSLSQTPNPAVSLASSASGSTLARRIRQIVAPPGCADSVTKQAMLFLLPIVLAAVGVLRVELVAKEPEKSNPDAVKIDANIEAILADAKADVHLMAEAEQHDKKLAELKLKLPIFRKLVEELKRGDSEVLERLKKNPNDAALRGELVEREKVFQQKLTEYGELRDQHEQADRDRDGLQKKLALRRQTLKASLSRLADQSLGEKLADNAWFLQAAGKLAVGSDPKGDSLYKQLAIYHEGVRRSWKGTDLGAIGVEWNAAARSEKLDVLPLSLKNYFLVRAHWLKMLNADDRRRELDREQQAVELLNAIVAFRQDGGAASDYWRRQIEQHPQNANDYRLVYLASFAREGAPPIEASLVEPLIPNEAPKDVSEFVAHCEILGAYAAQKKLEGSDFIRIRQRLLDFLSEKHSNEAIFADWRLQPANAPQLALERLYANYRMAGRGGESEDILRSLLASNPRTFEIFADGVGVSPRERRQWHMNRAVRYSLKNTPLNDAIETMLGSVVLPCWVDSTVASDETLVQLNANGPWIDVLRQLLAKSKYELRYLSEEVMWIGPAAERRQAEMLLGQALLRTPVGDPSMAAKLRQPISVEFVEIPLEDVTEFFRDYLRANLLSLAKDKPVSIHLNSLPTFLALSLICAPLELDWCAEEGVIVIGSPKQIETVHERAANYRRRAFELERRATAGSSAAKALPRPISFDFIETPLGDVVQFCQDYSQVVLFLAADEKREAPVVLALEQIPLAWGLELILMEHDLHWELLERVVFIGSEAKTSAAKAMIQARVAKREGCPPSLRDELTKNIEIEAKNAPLFAVTETLAKSVRAPIEMSEKVRHRKVNFLTERFIVREKEPISLDLALDLLCLLNDLTWRWTAEGAIRFE